MLPFTLTQAQSWRETYPTPFYIYDEAGIRRCAQELYRAFSWNPGFCEYFAVKATPTPAILRLLAELGCGADCASVPELMMAERSGMTGHRVILSSNETLPQEYRAAAAIGAIVNLDDLTQIDHMERAIGMPDTVCCRYNPGKFQITNDIMGHQYDSKFGMTKQQLLDAYAILKEKGVRHFGLHCMAASCSLENGYYPALARELFRLVCEIRDTVGVTIELVDLSGGIGIPYRPEETAVDILAVGEGVRQAYEEILMPAGISLRLCTEMGRYMTGLYGHLVTTVVGKKHIYKEYVGVDATACDLMRPAMYGAYHPLTVLGKENAPAEQIVDVVGSLCENNDKFAVDRPLPTVEVGDMLVISCAGAHGRAMGYNYNGKLRCAELLLREDGSVQCIRRAETCADYLATLDVDEIFTKAKGLL